MTTRQWKLAAFASFGSLGIAYLGTVMLTLLSTGAAWILSPKLPEEKVLLVMLSIRLAGGLLCAAVVVALVLLPRGRFFGLLCAFVLAVGATVVLTSDAITAQASPATFGIVAAIVALHLWSLRAIFMASRHAAF